MKNEKSTFCNTPFIMDKIELTCKSLNCPNYIEWSFGYGSICYSCKLAGESDYICEVPDNCPNKDKFKKI